MEELEEAQNKCEYPPRLQIQYIRNDPTVNLQYSFHIEKMKNKKSKVVAKFPLLETAKGNVCITLECLVIHNLLACYIILEDYI